MTRTIVLEMSSFAREAANFTNTESRYITYSLGITPIGHGGRLVHNMGKRIRKHT